MEESEKHIRAFEEYYASRNIVKVSKELHISRASLQKWKRVFGWKERCEERDKEINEQVQALMTPQWVATKALLAQMFLNQVNAAIKSGIAIADVRELVAVSKELRAILGEGEKLEVEFTGIEYVMTENHKDDSEL